MTRSSGYCRGDAGGCGGFFGLGRATRVPGAELIIGVIECEIISIVYLNSSLLMPSVPDERPLLC